MLELLLVFLLVQVFILWMLTIPFVFRIELDTDAERAFKVQIRWMYGLVRFSPTGRKSKKPEKKDAISEKIKSKSDHKGRFGRGGRFFLAMLRSEGFIGRVFRLITDCLSVPKIRSSQLYVRFGLDDPADTGQFLGVVIPIFAWLQSGPLPGARLESDFDQAILTIKGSTEIVLTPMKYIGALMSFLFSPELFRGIRSGMRARYS